MEAPLPAEIAAANARPAESPPTHSHTDPPADDPESAELHSTGQEDSSSAAVADIPAGPPEMAEMAGTGHVVYPWPEFRDSADRAAYVERVRAMLRLGLSGSRRNDLAAAEEELRAALRLADGDPRLHYGFGLILRKFAQYDKAIEQFERAIEVAGDPYAPAWQALVCFHVSAKKYPEALERLSAFAEAVGTSAPDTPGRDASAVWIGRMVAYLRDVAAVPKAMRPQIAPCEERVRKSLGEELRTPFELGLELLAQERAEFLAEAGEQVLDVEERERALAREKEKALSEAREQIEDQKEVLESAATESKEWFEEQSTEFDRQLTTLESSYNDLAVQGQKLAELITLLNGQVGQLEQQRDILLNMPTSKSSTTDSAQYLALNSAISQKTSERNNLVVQYQIAERRAAEVVRQAMVVVAKRQLVTEQYQRATGQIVAQSDALDKWNSRLTNENRKLASGGKANKRRAAMARNEKALTTYFPLDLSLEGEQILGSYPPLDDSP